MCVLCQKAPSAILNCLQERQNVTIRSCRFDFNFRQVTSNSAPHCQHTKYLSFLNIILYVRYFGYSKYMCKILDPSCRSIFCRSYFGTSLLIGRLAVGYFCFVLKLRRRGERHVDRQMTCQSSDMKSIQVVKRDGWQISDQ